MSILVDEKVKLLIQGVTGREGSFFSRKMAAYGTRVVAGVSPGKGGTEIDGLPVYDTVDEAVSKHGANTSAVFTPPSNVKEAVFEAIDSNIALVVVVSGRVPLHHVMDVASYAGMKNTTVIGPSSCGIISPGKSKVGVMSESIFSPGRIGVVGRSGGLIYDVCSSLTSAGLGQSTVVSLGSDGIICTSFVDVLQRFDKDPDTDCVVLIGELGGIGEEEAAEFIKGMSKPVIAYVAGKSLEQPWDATCEWSSKEPARGTYEVKINALRSGGARIAEIPGETPQVVKLTLGIT